MPNCYTCHTKPCDGYSAYCRSCQVTPTAGRGLKPGSNRCLCAGCGEYFTSPAAFDAHLRPPYDCTRPERTRRRRNGKPKLVPSERGWKLYRDEA